MLGLFGLIGLSLCYLVFFTCITSLNETLKAVTYHNV